MSGRRQAASDDDEAEFHSGNEDAGSEFSDNDSAAGDASTPVADAVTDAGGAGSADAAAGSSLGAAVAAPAAAVPEPAAPAAAGGAADDAAGSAPAPSASDKEQQDERTATEEGSGSGEGEQEEGASSGEGQEEADGKQPARKEAQPFDVPADGRFWLHDDRAGGGTGGERDTRYACVLCLHAVPPTCRCGGLATRRALTRWVPPADPCASPAAGARPRAGPGSCGSRHRRRSGRTTSSMSWTTRTTTRMYVAYGLHCMT